MLRFVARVQYSPVDQPARCWYLAEYCLSIGRAGIVEYPCQELWPFAWFAPSALLQQEGMPLGLAQVPFDEGKHCLFFVRQVLQY